MDDKIVIFAVKFAVFQLPGVRLIGAGLDGFYYLTMSSPIRDVNVADG